MRIPEWQRRFLELAVTGVLCAGVAAPAVAQEDRLPSLHVTAGSEAENYLRVLQLRGIVPEYPWSLRTFSPREIDSLSPASGSHPWGARYSFAKGPAPVSLLPLELSTVVNSSFPWGGNDGAVWAGRGATAVASAGVRARVGPLSLAVNPVVFNAANSAFAIHPNGRTGPLAFGDPQWPTIIDRPQRFGDDAYRRVDPGNSYLRLDWKALAAGVSTANEYWGPAAIYPFILGNNAPGFVHGFLGTARPVNVGIGRAHARIQWGRLEQSEYSPVTGSRDYVNRDEPGHSRFAPGLLLVFQPRGAPGLELGLARFFHLFIPAGGIPREYWLKPLEGFFEYSLTREQEDAAGGYVLGAEANQLASVFGRWVFPSAGIEVYGEYGREDTNEHLRDFIQEPDHLRSYMVGVAKAFQDRAGRVHSLRAELINFQIPGSARTRTEGSVYAHYFVLQGHTHRGQVLGAPVGVDAAAGSSVLWETFTRRGKGTLRWSRSVARERGDFHFTGLQDSRAIDVTQELDAGAVLFTRLGDISLGGALIRELNRNFTEDAWNLQTRVGLRRAF